jgi:hypothetical protein
LRWRQRRQWELSPIVGGAPCDSTVCGNRRQFTTAADSRWPRADGRQPFSRVMIALFDRETGGELWHGVQQQRKGATLRPVQT